MEKEMVFAQIKYNFGRVENEAVEIAEMRSILDDIEKLGATHIEIRAVESYGDALLFITAYALREETDQEYECRSQARKLYDELQEKRELELLRQLSEKYGTKS